MHIAFQRHLTFRSYFRRKVFPKQTFFSLFLPTFWLLFRVDGPLQAEKSTIVNISVVSVQLGIQYWFQRGEKVLHTGDFLVFRFFSLLFLFGSARHFTLSTRLNEQEKKITLISVQTDIIPAQYLGYTKIRSSSEQFYCENGDKPTQWNIYCVWRRQTQSFVLGG